MFGSVGAWSQGPTTTGITPSMVSNGWEGNSENLSATDLPGFVEVEEVTASPEGGSKRPFGG